MKRLFSKKSRPVSVSFDDRRGTVCDAHCRSEALRDAMLERALQYGPRFS
jgi:hypothetical protein